MQYSRFFSFCKSYICTKFKKIQECSFTTFLDFNRITLKNRTMPKHLSNAQCEASGYIYKRAHCEQEPPS